MVRPLDFTSRLTHAMPGLWDHVRSLASLTRPLRPSTRRDASLVPIEPEAALAPVDPAQVAVTWVGHATCIIRMAGLTLVTDPVWSRSIAGIRRVTPPGLGLDQVGRIDAVLISHDHFDHLDWPTLLRLPRSTPIFVGAGLARTFRRKGFPNVQSLDWWEDEMLGPLRITFVPAHHSSGRALLDLNRTLWGGWVVSDPRGRKVYFAGDTAYGPFFKQIGQHHPGIDVALFPVGAYEPRWYNANSHTSPEEAVQAVRDLGARAMVPIHWGGFLLSGEPVLEPIERARAAWDAAGLARRDLLDLALGETAILRPRARPIGRRTTRRDRALLLRMRAFAR